MQTIAPFRITVCGLEELDGHSAAGVTHVLSILDPEWPVPEAFDGFGAHHKLELRFNDVIEDTPGTLPPTEHHVRKLLAFGREMQDVPAANLLVHCHAGVSRSTASMALILAQALPQHGGEEVLGEVLAIRGRAWPNLRIIEIGDAMLGRGGTLIAATHGIYRRQLARRPQIADEMSSLGRAREIAAGSA